MKEYNLESCYEAINILHGLNIDKESIYSLVEYYFDGFDKEKARIYSYIDSLYNTNISLGLRDENGILIVVNEILKKAELMGINVNQNKYTNICRK